ncbi:hypothetical protein ACFWNT_40310 [Streptomyces sp. NPDC058409]|uniref:hypothetical protein n=1 Tax=Streptomyces sp. NPDC058409 TaxID=3346484 RepID=UPI0036638F6E
MCAPGTALHARCNTLNKRAERLYAEYERLHAEEDEDNDFVIAGNRTVAAQVSDAPPVVYDQLVTAGPSLAEEHRIYARQNRELAADLRQASGWCRGRPSSMAWKSGASGMLGPRSPKVCRPHDRYSA